MILATEPKFYVVYAFRYAREDFSIEGVFTKSEDAQALVDEVNASDLFESAGTCVQHLPYTAIIELLTKDRIADLAKVLSEHLGDGAALK